MYSSLESLVRTLHITAAAALLGVAAVTTPANAQTPPADPHTVEADPATVRYGTVDVDGVSVFYREAGDPSRSAVLLLHGFPTSSQMFSELIPKLSDRYYVLAPDYPGYGLSDQPSREDFTYSFDNMARIVRAVLDHKGVDRFAVYLMDYGAPVGFRLFAERPEAVTAFVVQNGNAYEEGLTEFWAPLRKYWATNAAEDRNALRGFLNLDATIWQYRHGTRRPDTVNPDNWLIDQPLLDRPGNAEIQLDMFYDYRTNV
ncbi:MAG: alpha/beta fold hydrolase, partial [Planctomycetota bacterium]